MGGGGSDVLSLQHIASLASLSSIWGLGVAPALPALGACYLLLKVFMVPCLVGWDSVLSPGLCIVLSVDYLNFCI